MKKLATAIAVIALIGTRAFAADMPVKAPPLAPAPVPTWTGFYGGIQFGAGWSDEAVNYSPNDSLIASVFTSDHTSSDYRIPQNGAVGGFEAGYNWQAGLNWALGFEADFSFSGMDGRASAAPVPAGGGLFVETNAQQRTDWYGTVRGRAGWLATPNLLLFGTGGFAYGKVDESANLAFPGPGLLPIGALGAGGVSFLCPAPASGLPCFGGSSSAIRTGWTAGGGVEWLLDPHWSFKVEYQFVDLGSETIRITAFATCTVAVCGATAPIASSFNAAFRDQFNVVRVGLNYRF